MKLVIQRVSNAKVEVNSKIIGQIKKGFLVLLGVGPEDNCQTAETKLYRCGKTRKSK